MILGIHIASFKTAQIKSRKKVEILITLDYNLLLIRMPKKLKRSIAIDPDLLEWIEELIEKKKFASVSQAIDKALTLLKRQYESIRYA